MKHFRTLALCLLLVLSLATGAMAAEVPEQLVVENLNGQQRMVKTYVLPPDADPETLKEPSIDYDGFTYTWAYTTKEEKPFFHVQTVTETVTVETASKKLDDILEVLAPSIPYDDGGVSGELALDHTTIHTEAAGYAKGSRTVTATKTIGPLDRNDMSYIPATTVKDGLTLSLSNVEWQIIGTDLVGEVLAPSSYQAIATYSGKSSYSYATGYVTTAEYKGEVTSQGIESITYTVVYIGEPILPVEPEPEPNTNPLLALSGSPLVAIGAVMLLCLLAALGVLLFRQRKNVLVYIPGDKPRDYKLIAKFRAEARYPSIDLREVEPYPTGTVAIELKRALAKELVGKEFSVQCKNGVHSYTVLQADSGDWHEFDVDTPDATL